MPKYFTNDPKLFRGSLLLNSQQYKYSRGAWSLTETYSGKPADVKFHRVNHATLYPTAVDVDTDEQGAIWSLTVTYGSTDPAETLLNSTWTLDGNQHELRISNHPKARILDTAVPGWTRFIEVTIDKHYQETPDTAFTYSNIQSGALKTAAGGALSVSYTGLSLFQLNQIAEDYAKLWERSVEAYLLPRWVIRNQVEVNAAFAFSTSLVLYANVNRMLNPFQMRLEPLQSGEVIPTGMVVPGVPWWHKQPFQKTQTSKNTFIINREYWGLESYEPFLYDRAVN